MILETLLLDLMSSLMAVGRAGGQVVLNTVHVPKIPVIAGQMVLMNTREDWVKKIKQIKNGYLQKMTVVTIPFIFWDCVGKFI